MSKKAWQETKYKSELDMKTPGFPHRLEVCESLPDLWCLNICPMHKHRATYHQTRKSRTKGKDKTIDYSNQKRTIITYMIDAEVDLYTIYVKIKVHETLMIRYIKCHVSELFYCCDKTGRDKSRKERSWFMVSEGSVYVVACTCQTEHYCGVEMCGPVQLVTSQ